jgi:hypothetical protein
MKVYYGSDDIMYLCGGIFFSQITNTLKFYLEIFIFSLHLCDKKLIFII